MGTHASAAQIVPYVTSKSTILTGVLYAEQKLRLSKNRQACSPKRTSVLTLVPWQGGRCLAWDATVVDMLAPSYVTVSAQVTGSAAQAAAERNVSKYAGLSASHLFVPITIETLGPINEAGHSFLSEREGVSRQSQTISESLSFFSSASPFSYKGLTRSHSEALLTQKQVSMNSRSSPFLT